MQIIQKLSVLLFLLGSMLGIGLRLTPGSVAAPLRDVKVVGCALILNFVIAPAFAWLLTVIIPLEHGHAVGLLLLGGAAGAPFLPRLVETARGDLPLAIALMVMLTAGTIFFIPFVLPHLIPGMAASPWAIARPLLLFILLPLVLGMIVKYGAPALAGRVGPVCTAIGNIALVVLFILLVGLNASALLAVVGSGAIAAVMLYIFGLFVVGWLLGGRDPRRSSVHGLTAAARNFGAALVPAAESFKEPQVTVMLIVSAIVCLVITFSAAGWARRRT